MSGRTAQLETIVFSVKLNRLEAAAFEVLLQERGMKPARFLKSAIAAEIEGRFGIDNPALQEKQQRTPVAS